MKKKRKDVRSWKVIASKPVSDHRIFKIRRDTLRSPRTGEEHPFVVLEGGDWVNVLAITPENAVVLIRQFRFGIRATTLEVPGGMVDAGESPARAAARELLEETGYAGDKAVLVGKIHPNPAIQTNVTHTFLIRNARKVSGGHQEGTEDILTFTRPLASIPRLIKRGEITHALVVVAFSWLWLRDGRLSASPSAARRRKSRSCRS